MNNNTSTNVSLAYTKQDLKWDKRISLGVLGYFLFQAAVISLRSTFLIEARSLSVFFGVLIIFFYLIGIKEVFKRSKKLLLLSYAIAIFFYSISVLMAVSRGEPINMLISNFAINTFAWWLPVGIWSCSVKNLKVLYLVLLKGGIIISLLYLLMIFMPGSILDANSASGSETYDMSLGFGLIVPSMLFLNEYYRTKKIWWLLISLFEFAVLVIFANRAILLSYAAFVVIRFVLSSKRNSTQVLVVILLIGMFAERDKIINHSASFLESQGLFSRTMYLLENHDIGHHDTRTIIWNKCYDMIIDRPILGWGISGESAELAKRLGSSPRPDFTAHNGLIQNVLHFGIFFGTLVNLLFILPFFKTNKYMQNEARQSLILVYMAYYVPLLVSASGFFIKADVAIFFYLFYVRRFFNPNKKF